jgi:hypothetical protein
LTNREVPQENFMRVGVDLDNTIVCYDELFHRLAIERGLIDPRLARTKQAVRNELRARGQEAVWTELQGLAYGREMQQAKPFPDVLSFFARCRRAGVEATIISHRTQHPFAGPRSDLHQAACCWLEQHGLLQKGPSGPGGHRVYLELTREAKLGRIAAVGCEVFVDDLPEFLTAGEFPPGVQRILFDPRQQNADHPSYRRIATWQEIASILLDEHSTQRAQP